MGTSISTPNNLDSLNAMMRASYGASVAAFQKAARQWAADYVNNALRGSPQDPVPAVPQLEVWSYDSNGNIQTTMQPPDPGLVAMLTPPPIPTTLPSTPMGGLVGDTPSPTDIALMQGMATLEAQIQKIITKLGA